MPFDRAMTNTPEAIIPNPASPGGDLHPVTQNALIEELTGWAQWLGYVVNERSPWVITCTRYLDQVPVDDVAIWRFPATGRVIVRRNTHRSSLVAEHDRIADLVEQENEASQPHATY